MKKKHIFFLFAFLVVFSSCKKEEQLEMHMNLVRLDESINVQCITFSQGTHKFVCGGIKGETGVIYKAWGYDGAPWQKVFSIAGNCLYSITFVNDTLGFACGENLLLLKTTDGGDTWVDQHSVQGQPPANYAGTLRSIYCVDANHIYVAGGKDYSVGITYKTHDGGGFWIYNTFDNELRSAYFKDKNTGYFSGYGTILKTTDSAETFHPLPIDNDFFTSVSFLNGDLGYACGYNGGLYKTSDGGNSWQVQLRNNNDVNHTRHFNQICFFDAEFGYVVGNNGLMMTTTDGGSNWITVKKFTQGNLYSVIVQSKYVAYATSHEGEIYRVER